MKSNKELNNQQLNNVSGGGSTLEEYLKSLVDKDKNKPLVDYGTGDELDLNPGASHDEADNLIIIKREKEKPE